MKQITNQADPKAALALIGLGAAFGSAFLFMKVLSDEISTFEIVSGRLTLAALALVAFMIIRREEYTMTRGNAARVAGLAIVDTVIPFSLVAWAETRIDAGLASLLISTMPIFTVIVAMTFLSDERHSPVRLAALPLGALGVITLTGGDILSIKNGDALGQLAVIGAAMAYGTGAVYSKVLLRSIDPIDLSVTKLAFGSAIAIALIFPTTGAPSYGSLSVEGAASIAGLGLISTATGFTLYLWLVRRAGSVYGSMVTYVVPVFGVLLGWAVLGEGIGSETALGAALVAAAVATVMYGQRLYDLIFEEHDDEIINVPVPATVPSGPVGQVTVEECA
jgi:drug/metabolite transporter (DMT)-like permease